MKKKIKITAVILALVALLAFVFWWGGNAPSLRGWKINGEEKTSTVQVEEKKDTPVQEKEQADNEKTEDKKEEVKEPVKAESEKEPELEEEEKAPSEPETEKKEETPAQERPAPIEPETAKISDKLLTCIISIRCDTVLNNMDWLDSAKHSIIPKDGVILAEKEVSFYEGESVFNLLLRETKRNKIHMEYVSTPIYHSAYIEGIGNLYEFDCGELSGWMYKVNGWFPNYGSSRYQLKEGDRVEWIYTCTLGEDIGGGYSARNGR